MNRILILFSILIASCTSLIAQDFQGKAYYQSKTSIDLDLENRQIPADRKKQIMERMKNQLEKTYELSFDRTSSLYVEEEKLDQPTANSGGGRGRGGFRVAFGANGEGKLYKNIQEKSYANETELFGKVFLIKDSLPQWDWKLSSETKKIGNYTCYKATVTKKLDTTLTDFFRRGPRGSRDDQREQEKPKDSVAKEATNSSMLSRTSRPTETTITVWYTPEIPISQGPSDFWGLPGLILEVNNGRTAILCTKIILNAEEKEIIKAPSKGKVVSQEEFDEIRIEKTKEMSERFRGGNRGNGGRGRTRN